LKKRQGRLGDTWHLDEVFVSIQGEQQYLWRAVDQDGDTIDILVQRRRNQQAAGLFFRRLLKDQGREPRWVITDKLKSYCAAHTGPSCRPSSTSMRPTRKTELKCHTNPRGNKNIICEGFLQHLKPNGF